MEPHKGKTMSESKHTPGPWRAVDCGADEYEIHAGVNRLVGHISPHNPRFAADAALFARAPDLLAEVEQLKTERDRLVAAACEAANVLITLYCTDGGDPHVGAVCTDLRSALDAIRGDK